MSNEYKQIYIYNKVSSQYLICTIFELQHLCSLKLEFVIV